MVRVPVLSELMAEVDPRVSTAGRLLMMAFFSAIATVPIARMVVTTAGRASGIEPIARETPMVKSVVKSSPWTSPITTMLRKASTAIPMMKSVTRSICRVSGVFSSFCSLSMVAI